MDLQEYLRDMIGDLSKADIFVKQFISKRRKAERKSAQQTSAEMQPVAAESPSTENIGTLKQATLSGAPPGLSKVNSELSAVAGVTDQYQALAAPQLRSKPKLMSQAGFIAFYLFLANFTGLLGSNRCQTTEAKLHLLHG